MIVDQIFDSCPSPVNSDESSRDTRACCLPHLGTVFHCFKEVWHKRCCSSDLVRSASLPPSLLPSGIPSSLAVGVALSWGLSNHCIELKEFSALVVKASAAAAAQSHSQLPQPCAPGNFNKQAPRWRWPWAMPALPLHPTCWERRACLPHAAACMRTAPRLACSLLGSPVGMAVGVARWSV